MKLLTYEVDNKVCCITNFGISLRKGIGKKAK